MRRHRITRAAASGSRLPAFLEDRSPGFLSDRAEAIGTTGSNQKGQALTAAAVCDLVRKGEKGLKYDNQSHIVTGGSLDAPWDVFANSDARALLVLLAASAEPLQYSRVREQLGVHPQAFQRSLERLEHHGFVGRILKGAPNNLGYRSCFLEATATGRLWAKRAQQFEAGLKPGDSGR